DAQQFYQKNTKLTSTAIDYGQYSEYLSVVGGSSTFWTKNEMDDNATALSNVILYDKYKYTFFYYESAQEKPMLVGFINENKTPATGKFRVRFLNISTLFGDKTLDVVNQAGTTIS